MRWSSHFDERVILRRRGAKPAEMAYRGDPLASLSFRGTFRALARADAALSLAIGGKFILPLQFELEFQTLDLALERFVLAPQIRG